MPVTTAVIDRENVLARSERACRWFWNETTSSSSSISMKLLGGFIGNGEPPPPPPVYAPDT